MKFYIQGISKTIEKVLYPENVNDSQKTKTSQKENKNSPKYGLVQTQKSCNFYFNTQVTGISNEKIIYFKKLNLRVCVCVCVPRKD